MATHIEVNPRTGRNRTLPPRRVGKRALQAFVWVRLSPESRSNGLSRVHQPVQGRLRRPLRGFALDSLARPR